VLAQEAAPPADVGAAQPVSDFFAAAQFLKLSQDERLSKPSFEAFTAGYVLGSDDYQPGPIEPYVLDYEEADLGIPLRILAVVASAENMTGGGAYRPGDILTAMNGKTIEVINTDAEGRLVLADALCYAREQGATHLVDMATLTGAIVLAMGDLYGGVYANDDGWRDHVVDAANAAGDHLWPLPLHRRYRRYVSSNFADMKNASILKEGSPALAAEFLREFAGDGPWAHIDLAGPAFIRRSRGDYISQQGGTGYGVRTIAELAQRLSEPLS